MFILPVFLTFESSAIKSYIYSQFVRMMLNLGVGYDIDDKSCDSKVWSCYNNSVVNTVNNSATYSITDNSRPVSSSCEFD
jgi:hypothetical protein